jgi:hypothetical protein
MPTTFEEAKAITSIIDDYLSPEQAKEITNRLNAQVGQSTDNSSLRISLDMLETLYEPKKMRHVKARYAVLMAVVALHLVIISGNILAAITLPFVVPWYVALPLITLIINLTFSPIPCPLTRMENRLRGRLQMPEVKHFMGYYMIWPVKRKFRERRRLKLANKAA